MNILQTIHYDNLLHATLGAAAASLAASLAVPLLPGRQAEAALIACALVAIGREVYNRAMGGKFSPADIAATLVGGVFVAAPLVLLRVLAAV